MTNTIVNAEAAVDGGTRRDFFYLTAGANRLVAVDFDKGVAVVEGKNGQIKGFPFDNGTLVIKN